MKRREFLTLFAAFGAEGWPHLLQAEPATGKIGYLHPVTISPYHITFSLLQQECGITILAGQAARGMACRTKSRVGELSTANSSRDVR
jgi:hypothetical protein